jgi:hypothetical protein
MYAICGVNKVSNPHPTTRMDATKVEPNPTSILHRRGFANEVVYLALPSKIT